MPLAHTEGSDHKERLKRVVAMAEAVALEAPERLKPLSQFSVGQARGHLEVISRFGRFPHRNLVLGQLSTPEEMAYLEKGDFVLFIGEDRLAEPQLGSPLGGRSRRQFRIGIHQGLQWSSARETNSSAEQRGLEPSVPCEIGWPVLTTLIDL